MAFLDRFRSKSQPSPSVVSEAEATGAPHAAGAPAVSDPAPEQGGRSSLLDRLRQGLKKTNQLLNTDIRDLFKREGELLDEAFLERLYAALVRTDMGTAAANEIRAEMQQRFSGRVVHVEDVLACIKEKLNELMRQPAQPLQFASEGPTVIVIVGVNGSGKTTSIAKLTHRLMSEGKKVVLGAGDTFRAAAVEQLTIWAHRLGAEIITGAPHGDPASVAHRAVARAMETQADVCIIDTAGRLQTQVNLMEQLTKIRRVITKQIPTAPHEVLLVLDATAGQNGISQARGFSQAAECTGMILAKLDGTAKGGVIIPIRKEFQLPVKFIGVGEQPADLAVFDSAEFVDALFDGLIASPNDRRPPMIAAPRRLPATPPALGGTTGGRTLRRARLLQKASRAATLLGMGGSARGGWHPTKSFFPVATRCLVAS